MMNYIIRKTKKRGKQAYCYSVINSYSRRIFSKCTTNKKAKRQQKILLALRYNKNFRLLK
jgi:hypothetical protein